MCLQHSLSCVLPAHASSDTCLRSNTTLSHKSVSWQLRHSVSLYRGPFTYRRCLACSASAWNITEVQLFFQGQSWALLSSTAHCCKNQRRMLFWPFCCRNKSCAAQERKLSIFTASFFLIYLLLSRTLHSTRRLKRQ